MLFVGAGESFQDLGTVSESLPVQHHQGRHSVCILGRSHGAAGLQAEALQDQIAWVRGEGGQSVFWLILQGWWPVASGGSLVVV